MAHKKTQRQQHSDFVRREPENRALDLKEAGPAQAFGKGVDLELIDRTFLNFIDKYIDAEAKTNKGFEKVKVLFSSKERWASLRNHEGIRDTQGRLILPLITVTRVSNEINMEAPYSELNPVSIYKRVHPQSVYSKQRLDYEDTQPGPVKPREIDATRQGPLYEFVSFPSAKSLLMTYEVSFWTDYMSQNNSIFEKFANNIERQLHYIFSDDGYYFPTKLGAITNDSNIEEYSDDEKIIRQTVNFEVQGYLIDEEKIRLERSAIEFVLEKDKVVKDRSANEVFTPTLGLNRKIF